MEEMSIAVDAGTSAEVKIWMNWMLIIFLSSLFFVWNRVSARYILLAFLVTIPVAIFIFNLTRSIHLVGISHIIIWGPLAAYLIITEVKGKFNQLKSIYGIYLVLLLMTIIISLFFDIRDAILILSGFKSAI